MNKSKKVLIYFSSIVFLVLVWQFFSNYVNSSLILPKPILVLKSFIKLSKNIYFWQSFFLTFCRVFFAFIISVILGSFIGLISLRFAFFKIFFQIPLSIIRSTPIIAIILITLFWFNSSTIPIFVAVLTGIPIMTTCIISSENSKDEKLLQMSKIYNFTKFNTFKYILLPKIIPFFFNGLQSIFGLCWKVVVAAEVLSLPQKGFGSIMQKSQLHLETSDVICVTLFLIFVSFILEKSCVFLFTFFTNK